MNQELPYIEAVFRKGRGTRDQIAKICWTIEKAREFQKKHLLLLHCAKAFNCVDHNKMCKILQEIGILSHLTCLLRNLYAGQEATVRTTYRTMDGFQIGKGVRQGCVLSSCFLTSVQNASCKMPDWMKHKLKSILLEEISITSDMQMTPPYHTKWRGIKELLDEGQRGAWKNGLKLNIQNTKIMAYGPIASWQTDGKTMEKVTDSIFLSPKSLHMVTAAMKLKYACSLEEKLWPT